MIYGLFFLVFTASVAGSVFYGLIQEFNKEFSLNPDWDATRDFIDEIPTYQGKRK